MRRPRVKNLLKNPRFEKGGEFPEAWEWVMVYGRSYWRFDDTKSYAAGRSVVVMQDAGRARGEFRQVVKASGSKRYRLRGRISGVIEGRGEESGANLFLRSLRAGEEIGALQYRPFLLGRHEWTLWSCDYVTPPGTDSLVVSFDMRDADGAAWFDDIELLEAPEPLNRSAAATECTAARANDDRGPGPTAAKPLSAHVFTDSDAGFLVSEVLCPLLGANSIPVSTIGRLGESSAEAIFLFAKKAGRRTRSRLALAELERLYRGKTVIASPAALVAALGGAGVRLREHKDALTAPCARIEKECLVTRGFTGGDVIPWWHDRAERGVFVQTQIEADGGELRRLGFEVIATSATASAESTGRPVVLWRAGEGGGGILVMDLELVNSRPGYDYHQNLAALILSNALGRPQASLGAYVAPDFDYDGLCDGMRALVKRHQSIRLREEGRSGGGRPIYSLEIGPEGAPAFFVDCGIHPYEWVPTFGALMYMSRLADEFERGLPWARALLGRLRFKCVPVYAPDCFSALTRSVAGVNLNRNFPVYWENSQEEDKGPAPLSGPETAAVAEILKREKIVAAVNWHETNADTNWIGAPGFEGRYEKYAVSAPAIFQQLIDPDLFFWHAGLWTQNTDMRNCHYHYMDSFPYLRDYGKSLAPFEIHYADSFGIDGLLVEQYGNSDVSFAATPQRSDLTGRIIEMLFGLQIGLVCRNHGGEARRVSIPLVCGGSAGDSVVFSASGEELSREQLDVRNGAGRAEGDIPAAGVLVVEFTPPPWETARR